jgi:signal transduction histidine kinase
MQKMDDISNKIAEQANLINEYLLPLLENEAFQVDKEDIEKIVTSTRTLEQRLLRILKDEVIFQTISDEELPRFLAKVRHDLRDLINAIQGYTEISL